MGITGDLTPVQRKALEWLALLTSGEATDQDLAAMGRWRDENPEHARALARLSTLVKIAKEGPAPDTALLHAPFYDRPITRRLAIGGAVAAVASYSIVTPPLAMWPSLAELSSDYRTVVGERKQVQLAKGLSVELNTATSVSLRNKPSLPGIDVVNGEIAVDASLPGSMQFAAYMPEGRILARNAVFDARRTSDGFRATCIKGDVLVQQNGRQVALSSGQEVVCRIGAAGPGAATKVDPVAVTAWQRGQLIFLNAPLREVVAEINRYRRGRIVIMSSDLADRRINANFWIDHLDDMATHLATFAHASTTSLPGGIVLLT